MIPRKRWAAGALCAGFCMIAALVPACTRNGPSALSIGAIYPLSGTQGPGGRDEYRGVQLATDMINRSGGVKGHRVQLNPIDAPAAAAAVTAVESLRARGIRFVLGSYGSTISEPAALQADRDHMMFWETGAVGMMAQAGQGSLVFRVPPTGAVLGGSAISFVDKELLPRMHRRAGALRYAVAYVDDAYGTEVARGAIDRIRNLGLRFAGSVPYDPINLDARAVVRRIAALRPNVLFVSAYVQDGVAIRRELVRMRVPLVVNIGSSSSYCMPAFGAALGQDAVGVFASDKPDAWGLNARGLLTSARALLQKANETYEDRYHTYMDAAALAGFSAAWALFHDVMPRAASLTPAAVSSAARDTSIPMGGLPNGSGLLFAKPGTPLAGSNIRAASVIWEWQAIDRRVIVWPPRYATAPLKVIPLPA